MGEPFKNLLNAGLVHEAAQHLARHAAGFDRRRFVALATQGLEALEMKARAMLIADALQATLPPRFADAADVLEAALAPAEAGDAMAQLSGLQNGLRGWILWPVGEFVARRGLAEPDRALQTLHAMTQRFTAEFAIRPFIVEHPALVFDTLARWTTDPSHHVRRLVSEGSRPRLPWGLQLKSLIRDPSPTLPLLHALQDDPSEYVRRSVANHLNDIAKDHLARGSVAARAPARSQRRAPRVAAPRQPHAHQAWRCGGAAGLGAGPATAGRGDTVGGAPANRARRGRDADVARKVHRGSVAAAGDRLRGAPRQGRWLDCAEGVQGLDADPSTARGCGARQAACGAADHDAKVLPRVAPGGGAGERPGGGRGRVRTGRALRR